MLPTWLAVKGHVPVETPKYVAPQQESEEDVPLGSAKIGVDEKTEVAGAESSRGNAGGI